MTRMLHLSDTRQAFVLQRNNKQILSVQMCHICMSLLSIWPTVLTRDAQQVLTLHSYILDAAAWVWANGKLSRANVKLPSKKVAHMKRNVTTSSLKENWIESLDLLMPGSLIGRLWTSLNSDLPFECDQLDATQPCLNFLLSTSTNHGRNINPSRAIGWINR